jgi:WhiB family redox-sensing transcriptional regulator
MSEVLFDNSEESRITSDQQPEDMEVVGDHQQRELGNSIAGFLQSMKELSGRSLEEMRHPLGVSKACMSNWVTGKRTPSPEYTQIIQSLFELSAEELDSMIRPSINTRDREEREKMRETHERARAALSLVRDSSSDTSWMKNGKCSEVPPDVMLPTTVSGIKTAKAICTGCDVEADCLGYAINKKIFDGVLAGTTGKERRDIIKQYESEQASNMTPRPH